LNCPFCEINPKNLIIKTDLFHVRYDKYPVSLGHMLIIPNRHFDNYFDATREEKQEIIYLIDICKSILDNKYKPDGYNIGINCGEVAGQTVMHLHVHLIPRYKGDMEDSRGGVRGVIPEKQNYKMEGN